MNTPAPATESESVRAAATTGSRSARCTATKTEQVNNTPTVRRCTRLDTPGAHADGYHQWMRVRWLVRPGTDNATGLRSTIQTLSKLDSKGRPL